MKNNHAVGDTVFVIRYHDKIYSISGGCILNISPFNADFQGVKYLDKLATIRLGFTGEIVTYCTSRVFDTFDNASKAIIREFA